MRACNIHTGTSGCGRWHAQGRGLEILLPEEHVQDLLHGISVPFQYITLNTLHIERRRIDDERALWHKAKASEVAIARQDNVTLTPHAQTGQLVIRDELNAPGVRNGKG